jgi:hypothetical protein
MQILPRDKQEWFHHPVTQVFLQELRETRQESLEAWAREVFTGATAEATAMSNAKALGGMDVLKQVIDLLEEHNVTDTGEPA